MNNLFSAPRAALAACALGAISATAAFADAATTPSTSTGTTCTNTAGAKHHHEDSVLTAAEKAQLKKAKEAAFAADPSLASEKDELKQKWETMKAQDSTMSEADKQALHEQAKAFHQDLRAAELKADPTLAPVFAKLDAAHPHHHHDT
jgi:hypothetical protein